MRRFLVPLLLVGLYPCFQSGSLAAEPAAQSLQERIKDEHVAGIDLWIYNDVEQARLEARLQGKPLFVTFRCVPCTACAGFDAEVAQGKGAIERLAREKFIAVRQVEMKGVDLSQFQFDYDLNWAAMFINPDGTVYARYGTQSAAGPDAYNSVEGLIKTMEWVLELHSNYPDNAEELAGKRGPAKPYKTAMEMPGLPNKDQRIGLTTRGNCIHCHNIHDAEHFQAEDAGTWSHDMLWRYPLPENIGLEIDARDGIRVSSVEPASPAGQAGIKPDEDVTHMNGQAITSIADMQWVLHSIPNSESTVQVQTSKSGEHEVRLPRGWKRTDFSWRGSLWSLSPRLRVWMPELGEAERDKLGIPADQKPLLVRWINRNEPGGKAAFDSGLREGDIVIELAGEPVRLTTQQFSMHMKLNYDVGNKLPLTVLRDGKRHEIAVSLVE